MQDHPVDLKKELQEMLHAARTVANRKKARRLDDLDDELDPAPKLPEGPRRGGAPLGNQNARKHGLYSRLLPPESAEDFHYAVLLRDCTEDLGALRLFIAELLRDPNRDPKVIINMFNALARMLSVQRRYSFF